MTAQDTVKNMVPFGTILGAKTLSSSHMVPTGFLWGAYSDSTR